MCTESTHSRGGTRRAGRAWIATLGLVAAIGPGLAWAQAAGSPATRTADEATDLALDALQAPRFQSLGDAPDARLGIPTVPPYKQEPPAAQRDFGKIKSPEEVPPPTASPNAVSPDPLVPSR